AVKVLVAPDVAARGIHVDGLDLVINFDMPRSGDEYVHRIGRTGRAGKTGIAVTLVDWDELPRWSMIDKALGLDTPEPAETYSSSPHLYEELNIPAEAGGTIGKARSASGTRSAGGTRTQSSRRSSGESTEDKPARRNRSRRRTRGGKPVGSHPEGGEQSAPSAATGGEAASPEQGEAPSSGRRRRRRRPSKASAAN
ncbi:C-terminal helicase domain-containing protein, partial [Mycolicibacterium poriferae]|uniref:C-terminal helicase domain-containing protein n=1 Tax=Mycolicibacterium poriferae TaxID=39694 RepID=UPI0024B8D001